MGNHVEPESWRLIAKWMLASVAGGVLSSQWKATATFLATCRYIPIRQLTVRPMEDSLLPSEDPLHPSHSWTYARRRIRGEFERRRSRLSKNPARELKR